jgi:hypothetical protein
MRLLLGAVAAVIAMAALPGSAPARTTLPAQKVALSGIKHALAKHWIDRSSAARYRSKVNRAASLIRRLPRSRSAPLQANLEQVARLSSKLKGPRAAALFGQLAVNDAYFAHHGPPANQTDRTDKDGIVYRYFGGLGFEFHPLANFGALNAAVAADRTKAVARLADALIERGVPQRGGGLGWEYYFNYSGGRAPWLSGMAQSVAAQAFSRAAGSTLDEDDSSRYLEAARKAFRAIPGKLVTRRASGPWVRLYSFNRLIVLNAQLQSIISLEDYANANDDLDASDLSMRMEDAAATELHRFDTGYWSYYSLPHTYSPLSYQEYVVRLLKKLALEDDRFESAAARFAAYAKQPPAFKVANAKTGAVRFWLSKPSSVRFRSRAGTKRMTLSGGWHTIRWKLPKRTKSYPLKVTARDWAGNTADFKSLPLVRIMSKPVWKVTRSSGAQIKSIRDAAEAGVAARAKAASTQLLSGDYFTVGAGLDGSGQLALGSNLGLNAAALKVTWASPAPAPDPAVVSQLRSIPAEQRLLVEIVADPLPASAEEQSELSAFVTSLVGQVPGIDDLILAPEPTFDTAPAYSAAVGAVRDAALAAARAHETTIEVGVEIDGSTSPKAALNALTDAFVASGRDTPIADELAFVPAPEAGKHSWTVDNYPQLEKALDDVFLGKEGSELPIVLFGVALPTTIPPEKVGAYPNPPGVVPGASENAQARAYTLALRSAVCLPNVTGLVLDRLVDGSGNQSGLFYADGSAKTSESAVVASITLALRGTLSVCPGMAARVAASTIVFPLEVSSKTRPRVLLTCTRDCLYLFTLEKTNGKPVLAKRGALKRKTVPTTVRLPRGGAVIGGRSYRLRVRLVAKTNPGPIRQYRSPVIKAH